MNEIKCLEFLTKKWVALVLLMFPLLSSAAESAASRQEIWSRIRPAGQVNIVEDKTSSSPSKAPTTLSPQPKPSPTPVPAAPSAKPQTSSAAIETLPNQLLQTVASKGKEIVNQKCDICHVSGAGGAPKLDDAEAWKQRLIKNKDELFQHVKLGFNAMPPKGTCVECSDDELKAAFDYLLSQVKK